ncbi:EF-P lysine aminoacylase EpmA [Thermodesulfobacteriota bacterium]
MRKPASSDAVVAGNLVSILRTRHRVLKTIRDFFDTRDYTEVETPVRVKCPGIDPYIDALPAGPGYYLATSPELHMKRLLAGGCDRLYQVTHAFRAEEAGHLHNAEFTMLEWYRTGADYAAILQETEALLQNIAAALGGRAKAWRFPLERLTVDELYAGQAGWRPSEDWDEKRYFLDWVELIEPFLQTFDALFVIDFPAPLASLAKLKAAQPGVCERFELFLGGIEVANAFSELTDYHEHLRRFETASRQRQQMGKERYRPDNGFLEALQAGLPECGGIAVGVDRLIMAGLGLGHIEDVQPFPLARL